MLKAIDLLNKVLEFIEMTPNSKEWVLTALLKNPPRYIRLQQIESLTKAFLSNDKKQGLSGKSNIHFDNECKLSVQSFLCGDFIKKWVIKDYKCMIQLIEDSVKIITDRDSKHNEIRLEELVFLYSRLVEYKRMLRKITKFNSSIMEGGSLVTIFSINFTNSISSDIAGKQNEIDHVLELLMNPTGLAFTEEELTSKFNYPTDDLDEVDMDFL